jgi:Ras family protein T1
VDRPETLERVGSHWLPLISRLKPSVPVILVGTKIDTRGADMLNPHLDHDVAPLMDRFPQVETAIECSAKRMLNVTEVFYFAQKAVLYPTAPLYDSSTRELRPRAVQALTRIFRLCDRDCDGVLSDFEFNEFQSRAFHSQLSAEQLIELKMLVRQQLAEGVSGSGLTLAGFLCLHHMLIQKGHLERTWIALRQYGYGDDLELRPPSLAEYLGAEYRPQLHAVELTAEGQQQLVKLFRSVDRDCNDEVTPAELDEMFALASPPQHPWDKLFFSAVPLSPSGNLPLTSFLALWARTALLEPHTALRYLHSLDLFYPPHRSDAESSLLLQHFDRQTEASARSCFNVLLLGPPKSGKSTLLDALLGRSFRAEYSPTQGERQAVNQLEVAGVQRCLILTELPGGLSQPDSLLANRERLAQTDLVCVLYDVTSQESFEAAAALFQRVQAASQTLELKPVLLCVPTHADQASAKKRRAPKAPSLEPVALTSQEARENLLREFVRCCMDRKPPTPWKRYITYGLLSVALIGGAFLAWRYWRSSGTAESPAVLRATIPAIPRGSTSYRVLNK